jgi:hypothetical protein
MEATKISTGKYWAQFVFWLAIISTMLYVYDLRQWFWLALPGLTTSFAKAMRLM